MEWYKIHQFGEGLKSIEQFFVEIAAHEEHLLTFGMRRALALPGAEEAIELLKAFNEDFSSLKRYMLRMDRVLGHELERLDEDGKLLEQVSLIGLRLRMAAARKPISPGLAIVNQVVLYLPYMSRWVQNNSLFGAEPVSLQKTIINLGRLRGLVNACVELISMRDISDDEVFKPSNINQEQVLELIDKAVVEVGNLTILAPSDRARLEVYLQEAKSEVLSAKPSWSKIIGALVIVGAITSGIADAPNAAKHVRDAIEYILGTSVERPLQKFLPPSNFDSARTIGA